MVNYKGRGFVVVYSGSGFHTSHPGFLFEQGVRGSCKKDCSMVGSVLRSAYSWILPYAEHRSFMVSSPRFCREFFAEIQSYVESPKPLTSELQINRQTSSS